MWGVFERVETAIGDIWFTYMDPPSYLHINPDKVSLQQE